LRGSSGFINWLTYKSRNRLVGVIILDSSHIRGHLIQAEPSQVTPLLDFVEAALSSLPARAFTPRHSKSEPTTGFMRSPSKRKTIAESSF
jgi:hypothetical protein